jgi:inorganic triphosphatase YgiF
MKTQKKPVVSSPRQVQHMGEFYVIAEDQKVEEAKNDVGKVRERIKGAIGLIHDKKWDDAGKLLEELLGDLEEAKDDVKEEAKK